MINNNTRSINIVAGWKIITTIIHKNTESNILTNTFQKITSFLNCCWAGVSCLPFFWESVCLNIPFLKTVCFMFIFLKRPNKSWMWYALQIIIPQLKKLTLIWIFLIWFVSFNKGGSLMTSFFRIFQFLGRFCFFYFHFLFITFFKFYCNLCSEWTYSCSFLVSMKSKFEEGLICGNSC